MNRNEVNGSVRKDDTEPRGRADNIHPGWWQRNSARLERLGGTEGAQRGEVEAGSGEQ